jgi:hypothetical protein
MNSFLLSTRSCLCDTEKEIKNSKYMALTLTEARCRRGEHRRRRGSLISIFCGTRRLRHVKYMCTRVIRECRNVGVYAVSVNSFSAGEYFCTGTLHYSAVCTPRHSRLNVTTQAVLFSIISSLNSENSECSTLQRRIFPDNYTIAW